MTVEEEKQTKSKEEVELHLKRRKWAYEVQTKPLPSWTEAFDYAYKLGLEEGFDKALKGL